MARMPTKLGPLAKALVRQVVGRLHVSASEVEVEKALARALSREAGSYPTFVRNVMREGHRAHLANVLIYRQAMGGRRS
jgi:hypothetical protein